MEFETEIDKATPLVSVIVPVYNTKEYLDRCVESLLGQTLKSIEVVLVDDGSTDGSSELCDMWACRDRRIKVVHKENGGLSDARNQGALSASASCLGFVDSDDFVDAHMYEILYRNLMEAGADISCCDVVDYQEGDPVSFADEPSQAFKMITAQEAMLGMVRSQLPRIWVPTKLYPRSLFDRGFRFPVGKTYEDAYTIIYIFSKVDKVVVSNARLYFYSHRAGSITTAPYGPRSHDVIDAWEHCLAIAKADYPQLVPDLEFRCYWARCVVLESMVRSGESCDIEGREALVKYLRENYGRVKDSEMLTPLRRLLMRVLRVSFPSYTFVVKIYPGR